MVLSDDQCRTFADDGLLRLRDAIGEDAWRPLRERVQMAMRDAGLADSDVPETEYKQRRKRVARALKHRLDGFYTDDLCASAQQLMAGDIVGKQPALLLMTMPGHSVTGPATDWSVPRRMWHTDAPRVTGPGVPGVIALAFLDTVRRGGGGTLFVAGSHRLLDAPGRQLRSKGFRMALKKKPYFDVLLGAEGLARTRFLEQGQSVDGVDVRLVELTGEPGDVVLADARALHVPAPNVQPTARLMVRGFFVGKPLAEHYRGLWPEYAKALSGDAQSDGALGSTST